MKRHGSNNNNNNVNNNNLSLSLSSLNWIVYFLVMFVVLYAHCSSYYAQIIRNHYWIHTLTALPSIITSEFWILNSLTAWLKQKSLAWIMHTILFMRVPLEVVPKKDSGNNTVGNDWGHSPYAALGLGKFLLKKGCKIF